MSPLFRGLGGIGEENGEMAELMPATSTGAFTPSAEVTDCDDSLSDSLSNYQFDITGHDLLPEPTKPSKAKLSTEQSSKPTQSRPLKAPEKPLKPKASRLFPPSRDPPPSPEHLPPSMPPKPTRPIVPIKSSTTRPLKIDRSRKRTGPSVPSQRSPRAETQNVVPTSKPISRAATHANLREAYRRDRGLVERKVPTRPGGITPAMPPYPRPHAETPDRNVTQVNTIPNHHLILLHRADSIPLSQQIPITTLFPTGLIPLDRAQDKFKHAHCLDRLPPQPDLTDSSTLSSGNHGQWSRGWSFSRAFKKQKA